MPQDARLTKALEVLQHLLTGMLDLVADQLADALKAASTNNVTLANQVRKRDDLVDSMEMKIDGQCRHILTELRPHASDFRLLMAAIKINTDLERIGDHSKNLAKEVIKDLQVSDAAAKRTFKALGDATLRILYHAHQAFENRDSTLAWSLINREDEVRQLHVENVTCIVSRSETNHATAEAVAHLVGMSKALERIADHAVNIAEQVIFWIEGVDVRHPKLQRSGAHARA